MKKEGNRNIQNEGKEDSEASCSYGSVPDGKASHLKDSTTPMVGSA
jgi:hypothetical protein